MASIPCRNTPRPNTVTDEKPYSAEEFTRWLSTSCQRQELPVTITNPAVLATIAVLLR